MTRRTIKTNFLQTIDWLNGNIVDWVSAGQQYSLDGQQKQLSKYHYAFSFDGSITSQDGQYAFIYKRLGTKGILLKNGEILREINRSYYQAEVYEYPAAFITFENKTYLAHCPIDYCQLDFPARNGRRQNENGGFARGTPCWFINLLGRRHQRLLGV